MPPKRQPLKAYDFKAPISRSTPLDPFLADLLETRAFRRLKHIRFLGGIDYLLVRSPNGARGNFRHTRYQHTLGVLRLAAQYCELREVSPTERLSYYAAAMLHDIGHAPLSHSLEPIFKAYFGLDHHIATTNIIQGVVPLGKAVHRVLRKHAVDIDRVLALISGNDTLPGDDFFSGPINFDTIEGILRTQSYSLHRTPSVGGGPEAVVRAATLRRTDGDREIVDRFWREKGNAYAQLINSPLGVLADMVSQELLERSERTLAPDDFYLSEPRLFAKFPGLRETLVSPDFIYNAAQLVKFPVHFQLREFYIDVRADFFKRVDWARYKQKKTSVSLRKEQVLDLEVESTGDLFDEFHSSSEDTG